MNEPENEDEKSSLGEDRIEFCIYIFYRSHITLILHRKKFNCDFMIYFIDFL